MADVSPPLMVGRDRSSALIGRAVENPGCYRPALSVRTEPQTPVFWIAVGCATLIHKATTDLIMFALDARINNLDWTARMDPQILPEFFVRAEDVCRPKHGPWYQFYVYRTAEAILELQGVTHREYGELPCDFRLPIFTGATAGSFRLLCF